jgi:hypothetical protein
MDTPRGLDDAADVGFVFCIASVEAAAPADYRQERMRRYLAQHGEPHVNVDDRRFLRMIAPAPTAPLADSASHPEISEAVRQQHAVRMACALRSVDRDTPLLTGETVERDEFTFLTGPFNGCPERTAVLRRTTSYAELLYLFSGATVDSAGRLLLAGPPSSAVPAAGTFAAEAFAISPASVATTIAQGVASGMLSAVGGAIAGQILNAVFPPGVPSYFDQVYEEMKRIVGDQLQQATIDQVDGAINNIKLHLATEYQPARQGKDLSRVEDRKFLFDLLQKYETTYLSGPGGMLGTLMDEKYAKLGLGVFLLGAGLHLALYQEMANVDPSNTASSGSFLGPLESSYGRPNSGTIAATAAQYATFAEGVWPQLLADRAAKIHEAEGTLCAFGDTTGASCRYYAWFRDDLDPGSEYLPGQVPSDANQVNTVVEAPTDKKGNNPGRDALMQEYRAYGAQKAQELTDSLSDPPSIVASWRQLVTTPIKVS